MTYDVILTKKGTYKPFNFNRFFDFSTYTYKIASDIVEIKTKKGNPIKKFYNYWYNNGAFYRAINWNGIFYRSLQACINDN